MTDRELLLKKQEQLSTVQQLLKYYFDCLIFESFFNIDLAWEDIEKGKIEDLTFGKKPKIIERLNKNGLKDDESSFIGFPFFKIGKKYIPISLWEYKYPDGQITPDEEVFFHRYIHESLINVEPDILENLQASIDKNPSNIFNLKEEYKKVIEIIKGNQVLTQDSIVWSPVIFISNKQSSPFHSVIQELENMIKRKEPLSLVTESFFSEDNSITKETENVYNIVSSNYPQNKAISNQSELITVIQGPPGTGKTQTILNLIAKQIIEKKNVLIASMNNQAVDNVIKKIKEEKLDELFQGYIRLGKKEVIKENSLLLQQKFETMISNIDLSEEDVKSEINKLRESSKEYYRNIKQIEETENKHDLLVEKEKMLTVLLRQLQSRIQRHKMYNLAQEFQEKNVSGADIEQLFADILLQPNLLSEPDSFFLKIIYKIKTWYYQSYFPEVNQLSKKYKVKNIGYFIEKLDLNDPLTSVARIHDVIKYINISEALKQCQNEIQNLSKYLNEHKKIIEALYKDKIKNDRELLGYSWKLRLLEFKNKKNKIQYIKECIDSLEQQQKIDNPISFQSFQELFPLALTSNLSARRTIPNKCQYDLVIVDEASQCSIVSLMSLLQIAKRICFIGDQNQLSHIVSVDEKLDKRLWEKNVSNLSFINYSYSKVSAFDRAINSIHNDSNKKHLLSYHYRCAPSIVNFSNQEFYSGKLKIMTVEPPYGIYEGGVHFLNIEGVTKERINSKEIETIVQLVDEIIVNNTQNKQIKSIGIITPFRNQADSIRKEVDKKAIVGTIHTFQGAECDAIIFSAVIAPGSTKSQIHFVQSNGKLINVAVTRAKKLLIVVGHEQTILNSNGFLTNLVNYIKVNCLNDLNKLPTKMPAINFSFIDSLVRKQLFNIGEKRIYDLLKSKLNEEYLTIFPKVPVKDTIFLNVSLNEDLYKYYLMAHFDFVIYNKDTYMPLFAVEYDGFHHRKNDKVISNDSKKNTICQIVNFPLIRISSTNEAIGWNEFDKFIRAFLIAQRKGENGDEQAAAMGK